MFHMFLLKDVRNFCVINDDVKSFPPKTRSKITIQVVADENKWESSVWKNKRKTIAGYSKRIM